MVSEDKGRPELVIGVVAAVGTDLSAVEQEVEKHLEVYGYKSHLLRLSSKLQDFPELGVPQELLDGPEDERIMALQTAGNGLRDMLKKPDALAVLGMLDIRDYRKSEAGDPTIPLEDQAYIIRSCKTPEEVETFRSVYGDGFILLAAYEPKEKRLANLQKKLAERDGDSLGWGKEIYQERAVKVIERDEAEGGVEFGQNVRDTFPLADAFLDAGSREKINSHVERVFRLIFDDRYITPSRDEQSMFFANAARLRSADLSRQVGAAVADKEGEIIAVACNEVPKYGGGNYWDGDDPDGRSFQEGEDRSYRTKVTALKELLQRLSESDVISIQEDDGQDAELYEKAYAYVKGTRYADLIEFFRSTHAEIGAILAAGRKGVSTKNLWLYSTTFPCHECTRHLVTAGISRVIYVEPYPKSLGPAHHKDSVSLEQPEENKVLFEPYVGIGARLYPIVFRMRKRKGKDGKIVQLKPKERVPLIGVDYNDLTGDEKDYTGSLRSIMETMGVSFEEEGGKTHGNAE